MMRKPLYALSALHGDGSYTYTLLFGKAVTCAFQTSALVIYPNENNPGASQVILF